MNYEVEKKIIKDDLSQIDCEYSFEYVYYRLDGNKFKGAEIIKTPTTAHLTRTPGLIEDNYDFSLEKHLNSLNKTGETPVESMEKFDIIEIQDYNEETQEYESRQLKQRYHPLVEDGKTMEKQWQVLAGIPQELKMQSYDSCESMIQDIEDKLKLLKKTIKEDKLETIRKNKY